MGAHCAPYGRVESETMHLLRKIGFKFVARAMLALFTCALLFHLSVLAGLVPYSIVWGGRLETESQMYRFEFVSILINLAVMAVVAIKGGYMKPWLPAKVVTLLLWILAALFLLNTVGNLLAQSMLETLLFTPVTLIGSIFLARMAMEP